MWSQASDRIAKGSTKERRTLKIDNAGRVEEEVERNEGAMTFGAETEIHSSIAAYVLAVTDIGPAHSY